MFRGPPSCNQLPLKFSQLVTLSSVLLLGVQCLAAGARVTSRPSLNPDQDIPTRGFALDVQHWLARAPGPERLDEQFRQPLQSPLCTPTLAESKDQSPPMLGDLGGQCGGVAPVHTASENPAPDRQTQADQLRHLARQLFRSGQFQEALQVLQTLLPLDQALGDRLAEATTLRGIGTAHYHLHQYEAALQYLNQALGVFHELGDRPGAGITLNNIAGVYDSLTQYDSALQHYQQALVMFRETENRRGEATALSNIGYLYQQLSQYPQALATYTQALSLFRAQGNQWGEATTLNNMAGVYERLSQYAVALQTYRQALVLRRTVGDRPGEGITLSNIGLVYHQLNQPDLALQTYAQALTILKAVGDRPGISQTRNNMAGVYTSLGQYETALQHYRQALKIRRGLGDRAGEGQTLHNMAYIYDRTGQPQTALQTYGQALALLRAVGNRTGEGKTLNNMGFVYRHLGRDTQALATYHQALVIAKGLGDRTGTGRTLSNMGHVLLALNQPQLAIVFFKDAVNTFETVRQGIRELELGQQQAYADSVAGTYRRLADVLLRQDRILEAQQVLDLLKVQELQDYLQDVRGPLDQSRRIPTLPAEQPVVAGVDRLLNQAIAFGQELAQLRQIQPDRRTPAQQQRLAELVQVQAQLTADFNAFMQGPAVIGLIQQRHPAALSQDLLLRLQDFHGLRDNLNQLGHAVLLYPLVLDDRIELILTTPNAPPIRRQVAVAKPHLNETIRAFRAALQNPNIAAQPLAQQLYNWLIQPLAADLAAAQAQTILYAPDGPLRYIPLAALHDGEQWLVQRYRINHITAASLTDLNTQPQPQLSVLAGAFTTGQHHLSVGGKTFEFAGLPFAKVELDNLAQTVPATTSLLDQAFNPAATVPQMADHTIVHLATHGAVIPGQPEQSFILFGNGTPVTLREIQTWSLTNVDLIVLSACETGVGGPLGNGEEILGLGYQIQRAGARAAIASLWSVSDGGTQVLMDGFYRALQAGMTKAEALRQGQIALITGAHRNISRQRAGLQVITSNSERSPVRVGRLDHPYYWAPFILIGNGL